MICLYAIKDTDTKKYVKFFTTDHDRNAVRHIGFDTRRENSILNLDPKHFELHKICELEEEEGTEGTVDQYGVIRPNQKLVAKVLAIKMEFERSSKGKR
jgi:hypothetical protein